MPIVTKHITLNDTTAVALTTSRAGRTSLILRNQSSTSAEIIRVGDSTVTKAASATTAGLGIPAGEYGPPILSSPQGGATGAQEAWYAIAESGTPVIEVCEIREL